jgi:hypothetical protein
VGEDILLSERDGLGATDATEVVAVLLKDTRAIGVAKWQTRNCVF